MRKNGRKTFVLTNSGYSYTDVSIHIKAMSPWGSNSLVLLFSEGCC